MNLVSFFYDFTSCPFCNCNLAISITPNNIQSENTIYTPLLEGNRFLINIDTSRFVLGKSHSYISIDLKTGIISKSNSLNNFIDLYQLNLQIRLFCDKGCIFMKKINFIYDYKSSDFKITKQSDGFAFDIENTTYEFYNYYDESQSRFSKRDRGYDIFNEKSVCIMPIIDLKQFNYNKEKLIYKLENLAILI